MTTIRRTLAATALFEALSTVLGFFLLLFRPEWFAFMLEGTSFENLESLAAVILGFVVGGAQWAALWLHCRARQWAARGIRRGGGSGRGMDRMRSAHSRQFHLAPCTVGWNRLCSTPARTRLSRGVSPENRTP